MRILVIEDERDISERVGRGLRSERYAVDVADTGDSAWAMANTYDYDLMVLDLGLPGIDGLELLRRLRLRRAKAPILILKSQENPASRDEIFSAGADDYIIRPFAFAEMALRVKALLRRTPIGHAQIVRVADLEIDLQNQRVKRAGRRIELTRKEYALLEYLATHVSRVVSRSMIVEHVWDPSFEGLTNIVDVYVRHLRSKVDDPFPVKLIHSIRGVGYGLMAEGAS